MVCYISLFSEFSMLMYYLLFSYYVLCSHVQRVSMETYQLLITRTKCGLGGCFSYKNKDIRRANRSQQVIQRWGDGGTGLMKSPHSPRPGWRVQSATGGSSTRWAEPGRKAACKTPSTTPSSQIPAGRVSRGHIRRKVDTKGGDGMKQTALH